MNLTLLTIALPENTFKTQSSSNKTGTLHASSHNIAHRGDIIAHAPAGVNRSASSIFALHTNIPLTRGKPLALRGQLLELVVTNMRCKNEVEVIVEISSGVLEICVIESFFVINSINFGVTVAERLSRSPLATANRFQYPAGSPDFRKWESSRAMQLVGGFSRGFPVFPAPSFRRRSVFTSIPLIGSKDLAVKSSPNLFTHSISIPICLLGFACGESCLSDAGVTWASFDEHDTTRQKRRQWCDKNLFNMTKGYFVKLRLHEAEEYPESRTLAELQISWRYASVFPDVTWRDCGNRLFPRGTYITALVPRGTPAPRHPSSSPAGQPHSVTSLSAQRHYARLLIVRELQHSSLF
ncbi:hypothetical protein PR048_008441 [Dryococelus australis]|uniref:Uncharacterized protein n=1 Tax=Dryococelus australis TaxID=614101 RepID=A0ABQ9HX44_9NEOP|nr:hypothetical protein PR048_008441 [Dryococelus australis]